MKIANVFITAVCLLLWLPLQVGAKTKPLWVQRGERVVNSQRTNDTYSFAVVSASDYDLDRLKDNSAEPLLAYVRNAYQADSASMRLESVTLADGAALRVRFRDIYGEGVVYARRMAEYEELDEAVDAYIYDYYQLYEVSARNVTPQFDPVELEAIAPCTSVRQSLVPGLGQLKKGQTGKGVAIIATEVSLLTGIVLFQHQKNYTHRQVERNADGEPASWRSKENTWRTFRNIAIAAAVGVYALNLIDAGLSESPLQAVVKPAEDTRLTIAPAVGGGVGMHLSLNF